jgi:hypothetical protein
VCGGIIRQDVQTSRPEERFGRFHVSSLKVLPETRDHLTHRGAVGVSSTLGRRQCWHEDEQK